MMRLATYSGYDNETDIRFDLSSSYWPTRLKINDLFNHNFKLVVVTGNIGEHNDMFVGWTYKGNNYVTGEIENAEPNHIYTFTWKDKIPTIGEFFEALGDKITETQTKDLTFICGYITEHEDSTVRIVITDSVDTSIYVEVPSTDWTKIILAGGVGIAALGLVLASRK